MITNKILELCVGHDCCWKHFLFANGYQTWRRWESFRLL